MHGPIKVVDRIEKFDKSRIRTMSASKTNSETGDAAVDVVQTAQVLLLMGICADYYEKVFVETRKKIVLTFNVIETH